MMICSFNGTVLVHVMPPLLVTEFILGILGNGLALWIFCFHLRPWKSSTVYLFNLALADFFLNFALPFRASYYQSGLNWHFGHIFCNFSLFMLAMNRTGCVLFLMAVATDRYMRVVHPHHAFNSLSIAKAVRASVVLWMVTFSTTAHLLITPRSNATDCESFSIQTNPSGRLIWHKGMFVLSFYLPLAWIVYCTFRVISHMRKRQLAQQAKIKKALCFITLVAILFIICFLPSNICQLLIWFQTRRLVKIFSESEVCEALEDYNTAFYVTISLTYMNSMLDPVVYYFSSPAFKNICRKAIQLGRVQATENTVEKKTGSHSTGCDGNMDMVSKRELQR